MSTSYRHTIALMMAAFLILVDLVVRAEAQPLPIAPSRIRAEVKGASPKGNTWKIGPMTLDLPEGWVDPLDSSTVVLKSPDGANTVFFALH